MVTALSLAYSEECTKDEPKRKESEAVTDKPKAANKIVKALSLTEVSLL